MPKVIEITRPDGKVAELTAPDGASDAQIQQVIDGYIQSLAPPAPQPSPDGQGAGAPVPPPAAGGAQMTQPPAGGAAPPPPVGRRGMPAYQGIDPLSYGVAESLANTGRGLKQLGQMAFDDEGYEESLKQEGAKRAEWAAGRPSEANETFRGGGAIGRVLGEAAPALIPGGGALRGAGLLARTAASGAAGAAAGAAQPLTAEESARGDRTMNALRGGAFGAALPGAESVVRSGGRYVNQLRKNVDVDEAMTDYMAKKFNLKRGESEVLQNFENVSEGLEAVKTQKKAITRQMYNEAEKVPGLPQITLNNAAERSSKSAADLPQNLVAGMDARARKIVESLRTTANRDTGILHPKGGTITTPYSATYHETREAIRQLSKEIRRGEVNPNSPAAANIGLLTDLRNSLKDDIEAAVAKDTTGRLAQSHQQALGVDQWYKENVLKFYDKKTELGKYSLSPQSERNLKSMLLSDNSGMTLKELKQEVPGVVEDLRRIHAHDALQQATPEATIKKLEGGTTGEVLYDKSERAYQAKLADKIRKRNKSGEISKAIVGLGHSKVPLLGPVVEKLVNASSGLEKYGEDVAKSPKARKLYADMLRGMAAGQLVGD